MKIKDLILPTIFGYLVGQILYNHPFKWIDSLFGALCCLTLFMIASAIIHLVNVHNETKKFLQHLKDKS